MHVIYVRGLGNNSGLGQRLTVAFWRAYGVKPHYFAHNWADSESYVDKQQRLIKTLDLLHEKSGIPVGLVGVSAGASLAMNVYAERKDKVKGVVCISGKILHPETLDPELVKRNPAFYDSMKIVGASLAKLNAADRAKIRSVYSSGDHTVHARDSIITDAHNELVGNGNHGRTIAQQITVGTRENLNFLKQL